ncbi:MAG: alpha/beta hydrolase, partial [Arenicellales bacterium]|nr:alpha/beta hydrolase [Arenicellales bacterium]
MLYKDMEKQALDAAYNNTAAVGMEQRDQYVADWVNRSGVVKTTWLPTCDISYGPQPRQRLDVFPCKGLDSPTLLYIHGGYWQMSDKEAFGFIGEGLLAAGINLVLVEYTLAPNIRMDGIVEQIRASINWTIENISDYGGSPEQVFIGGHSAGGHLTAMAMSDRRVAGGVAISGIFDLEPIRLNYLNEKLHLDVAESARNSPLQHIPAVARPLIVTVGSNELPELIRQSKDYSEAWQQAG